MKLNSKGQMVIESILLMIVMVAIVNLIRVNLKQSDAFKTMVQAPWKVLSGMIQAGAWATPEQAMQLHPNKQVRQLSITGKAPK